ncbi:MAG: SDR family NAD(P)-dependent oxidoreductase [Brevundimonas sp.]|jgi:NAD(P)-dependent dehydrogenase (short-subunit alcohol dehydrogenase family)|nr:SDR family NAD(P)-dependent oxidoreductase [Brevundimonas sp.]
MTDIANRVAFITGAGGGLGAGIARALAAEGASLALLDINPSLLAERKAEFDELGVPCEVRTIDISDAEAVTAATLDLTACLGPITLCINNAGVGYVGAPLDQVPLRDLEWVFAVNVIGAFNCLRALVPAMRRASRGGHIVNVASIDAFAAEEDLHHAPYCASKAAVVMLSEGLRHDLRGTGIGTTVVCPGLVQSALPFSARNRPERFGGTYTRAGADAFATEMAKSGMDPNTAGQIVAEAIKQGRDLVFTHPELGDRLARRQASIDEALAWSKAIRAAVNGT